MNKRIKVFFTIAAIAAGLLCMVGCKTKYVTVERVHTDTLIISKHQRDSIYLHDSTSMSEKQMGDTIYIKLEKWHTKYVYRAVHDTTYISTTDSVPVPYPIEKALTIWQRTKIRFGGIAIGVCAAIIAILLFHFYRKLRP